MRTMILELDRITRDEHLYRNLGHGTYLDYFGWIYKGHSFVFFVNWSISLGVVGVCGLYWRRLSDYLYLCC